MHLGVPHIHLTAYKYTPKPSGFKRELTYPTLPSREEVQFGRAYHWTSETAPTSVPGRLLESPGGPVVIGLGVVCSLILLLGRNNEKQYVPGSSRWLSMNGDLMGTTQWNNEMPSNGEVM